jgi:hypothetical protein
MNNPLSDDPAYDLYPYPEGSTGWRLWKMLPDGMLRADYLSAFERRNLLRARTWSKPMARMAAAELLPSLAGRTVVVLGSEVRAALGLPKSEPLGQYYANLGTGFAAVNFHWVAFPHPSGRNLWFNQPENYARAREVLTGLLVDEGTGA